MQLNVSIHFLKKISLAHDSKGGAPIGRGGDMSPPCLKGGGNRGVQEIMAGYYSLNEKILFSVYFSILIKY